MVLALIFVAGPRIAIAKGDGRDSEGWIKGRLESLTIEQKLGQLLMVGLKGHEISREMDDHFHRGSFGGVILFAANLGSEDQIRKLTSDLQLRAYMDTGIPAFIAVDQEGGVVNRMGPVTGLESGKYSARTIGRLYDYDFVRTSKVVKSASKSMARKMREFGINMNLAPVLDLTDDRHSFIYQRSYGSNPSKVTVIGRDVVSSMRAGGVIATGKHFPNLGDTWIDSHVNLPVVEKSTVQLKAHEWRPFSNLRHDLDALMVGHVLVPNVDPIHPASMSIKMGSLIRRDLGFGGVVITDDLRMGAITKRYSLTEAVLRSVGAGYDVLLGQWDAEDQLEVLRVLGKAIQKKRIREERIDESLRRILTLKYQLKNIGANGGT